MNTLSLFTGIGGLDLGVKEWCNVVAMSEIDAFCCSVLEQRFKNVPNLGDIKKITAVECQIDAIIGGFPCQDLSCAGKGAGLNGKRSGLFFEVMRLVDLCKPSMVFLENVAMLRQRGFDIVLQELKNRGFEVAWTTLAAAEVGALHRRERMFILARLPGCRTFAGGEGFKNYVDWTIEPNILRTSDYVQKELKALGNAVVPFQANVAFRRMVFENSEYVATDKLERSGCCRGDQLFMTKYKPLQRVFPPTIQRFKPHHNIPTPAASDIILRKPAVFRPGVNVHMSPPRYVGLFPTRETPLHELRDGYLVDESVFNPYQNVNKDWVTWLMGFPEGWLNLENNKKRKFNE